MNIEIFFAVGFRLLFLWHILIRPFKALVTDDVFNGGILLFNSSYLSSQSFAKRTDYSGL